MALHGPVILGTAGPKQHCILGLWTEPPTWLAENHHQTFLMTERPHPCPLFSSFCCLDDLGLHILVHFGCCAHLELYTYFLVLAQGHTLVLVFIHIWLQYTGALLWCQESQVIVLLAWCSVCGLVSERKLEPLPYKADTATEQFPGPQCNNIEKFLAG